MILGFDAYGELYNNVLPTYDPFPSGFTEVGQSFPSLYFNTMNPIEKFTDLELFEGEYDEVNLTTDLIEPNSEGWYSSAMDHWQPNNVFLLKFQGDLTAGNVGVDKDNPATHVKVYKKVHEQSDDMYELCRILKYDANNTEYSFTDKYVEAESNYDYAIQSMSTSFKAEASKADIPTDDPDYFERILAGIEQFIKDNPKTSIFKNGHFQDGQEFLVSYHHAHIFDELKDYHLIYDLEINPIAKHINGNAIETLGDPYPYVVYSGALDYKSSSLKCILVADATGTVNKFKEKQLRNEITDFLCNKEPKILRVEDGTYLLINIVGQPQLTPNNNLRGIYELSFEFVEIEDANNQTVLYNLGLVNPIYNYFSDIQYPGPIISSVSEGGA